VGAADAAVRSRAGRRPGEGEHWTAVTSDLVGQAEAALAGPTVLLPPAAAALAVAHAELSRAVGQTDAQTWADVAAGWQALGDTYRAGCALAQEAECHLAARRRAQATAALRGALRAAITVRAQHLLRAVEATAARARLPLEDGTPERQRPFHLSARESDVLTLVAGGRTDRQIGAELFISHRTVERHVSNILAKLDARTRAEITAIAHRSGLVPSR
jgi:DNA-binding CsgD family transcriptional regulator